LSVAEKASRNVQEAVNFAIPRGEQIPQDFGRKVSDRQLGRLGIYGLRFA
jgi:hypothetical protein